MTPWLLPRRRNLSCALRAAANEIAIAHRLAFYLECELRIRKVVTDEGPIVVDCEYDRHLYGRKKLETESAFLAIVEEAKRKPVLVADSNGDPVRNSNGSFEFLVRPDIIVHERQSDANYLVVEVKKRTSAMRRKWEEKYDDLKLKLFTTAQPRGYGYKVGAWILVEDDCAPQERCLSIAKKYKARDEKSAAR